MTRTYAPRDNTLGICAKSGKQMRLGDMVEDGYYEGLMVDPAWYDPPHPQEKLLPIFDPESVERPSPDLDSAQSEEVIVQVPVFNIETGVTAPPLEIIIELNNPTVTVS